MSFAPMGYSLEQWKNKGQYYQHQSQPVFYLDEGTGPALVLIHGFPTASWDWQKIWPQLSTHYRCIAPDMMGFGFSPKPLDYSYSILDQADLIEGLLNSLGIKQAHILAHDYGDTVAQELLARWIDRRNRKEDGLDICSVCLLNGGLFPETHRARLVQKLLNSPLGALLSRLMNQKSFSKSFARVFGANSQPSEQELQAFWELVSHNDGSRISHKLIRYIGERRQHRERWVSALQNADIPIRVINGPDDPVSGLHMTERYRELIEQPDIVLLPGIGHYPQVEDAESTLHYFLAFQNET